MRLVHDGEDFGVAGAEFFRATGGAFAVGLGFCEDVDDMAVLHAELALFGLPAASCSEVILVSYLVRRILIRDYAGVVEVAQSRRGSVCALAEYLFDRLQRGGPADLEGQSEAAVEARNGDVDVAYFGLRVVLLVDYCDGS